MLPSHSGGKVVDLLMYVARDANKNGGDQVCLEQPLARHLAQRVFTFVRAAEKQPAEQVRLLAETAAKDLTDTITPFGSPVEPSQLHGLVRTLLSPTIVAQVEDLVGDLE